VQKDFSQSPIGNIKLDDFGTNTVPSRRLLN
jgi:hypothetical protein